MLPEKYVDFLEWILYNKKKRKKNPFKHLPDLNFPFYYLLKNELVLGIFTLKNCKFCRFSSLIENFVKNTKELKNQYSVNQYQHLKMFIGTKIWKKRLCIDLKDFVLNIYFPTYIFYRRIDTIIESECFYCLSKIEKEI